MTFPYIDGRSTIIAPLLYKHIIARSRAAANYHLKPRGDQNMVLWFDGLNRSRSSATGIAHEERVLAVEHDPLHLPLADVPLRVTRR